MQNGRCPIGDTARFLLVAGQSNGRGRNRTGDTRIFSPLLYQLSYPSGGSGRVAAVPDAAIGRGHLPACQRGAAEPARGSRLRQQGTAQAREEPTEEARRLKLRIGSAPIIRGEGIEPHLRRPVVRHGGPA
jgi:hypothetical protein